MSDLIDRQAAIDAIEQHKKAVLEGLEVGEGIAYGYAAAHTHLVEIVRDLPSAQPEIIRCKDCRFNDGVAYCEMHYRDVKGNDFCSWAERREHG